MTRFRRFAVGLAAAAAAAAAASLSLAPAASAAPAPRSSSYSDPTYYSVPYSDDVYVAYDDATQPLEIGHDLWVQEGMPPLHPLPTVYKRYPWSSAVYAVSFPNNNSNTWISVHLSPQQFRQAGSPTVSIAGWLPGTEYDQYATSPEIFATLEGVTGKLTPAQWAAAGFRRPTVHGDEGYEKRSWNGTIAYYYQLGAGDGYAIGYRDWSAAGFPTPRVVRLLPDDEVCTYSFDRSAIYVIGSGLDRQISYAEWRAAGFPRPGDCLS